jgi:chromosome segregation protein
MQSQFAEQFQAIRQAFQEQFVTLFGGGSADLTIVEQEVSELEEATEEIQSPITGVEITVHPPGKKPSHLNLLSGGEKALTSLALLLAIVHVQQPPFVVLDEVDAALDEANSFRFAQMLHELKTKTQCIIITHNRETMGQADVLYGITMQQDGISQVYSVKLADVTAAEFGESVNEVTRTVVSE